MKRGPRKILHVLHRLNETYGGPLRLVLDLSARAEGSCLSSQIVGLGPLAVRDNPFDAGRIHGIHAAHLGGYAYSGGLRPWLRRHLSEFDGVVIHGAWVYPGWAAAVECARVGVPYAYYPHGMIEDWAVRGQGFVKAAKKLSYWSYRERTIAQGARCTLFTTERERERTHPFFRIVSPQRILRPYGMEPCAMPVGEPDVPSLMQPRDSRIALFLGRLHPKKNLELLVEAWQRARMPPVWRLVIAGSGDAGYERKLQRLAGESESIRFVGFVSGQDKRYLLQRANWFLLPSRQENFGVAVLEAVEQGCAVAISEQVYLAESFRPESEVLPPRLESWIEFFNTRMQDPVWRRSVRQQDRDHLMTTFRIDRIVQQWAETFLELFPQRA